MYRLIIVDDDITLIEGIKKHIDLKALGLELAGCAYNGLDGAAVIRTHKPDIVLSDISMPVMSGMEMIEQLAQEPDRPLFILLTGHDEFAYAKKAISAGVIEYIVKPAFPDDIIPALSKAIKILNKNKHDLEPNPEEKDLDSKNNFDSIVYKMKQYASENFSREILLEDLSARLSLSPNYLRTIFKNTTGVSYKKYITELRMIRARELLSSGKFKVYEVAEQVGFRDLKHFRQVYLKYYGITPKQEKLE